jgi:pimeloyl-ACP methyl ester carboxylesterase
MPTFGERLTAHCRATFLTSMPRPGSPNGDRPPSTGRLLRWTDQIEPLLDRINCPVAVLWGAEDHWLPADQGTRLASLLPSSTFHTIPDAGHLVHEDAPEAIVAHLINFSDDRPA